MADSSNFQDGPTSAGQEIVFSFGSVYKKNNSIKEDQSQVLYRAIWEF